jgi:protein required for attachment to host cells
MTRKRQPARLPVAWIVVADRARARIYECPWPLSNNTLNEVDSLEHPEGKMKASEVLSDNDGLFSELATGPHNGEPQTDFRHRTANDFALIVAERLEKGRVNNRFGHLVVVAPALFLGVLRGKLSDPLTKLVQCQITKDYTQLPARELLPALQQSPEFSQSR